MSALLDQHGFGEVTHVGQHDMVDGTLWSRTDALQPSRLFQLADGLVRAAP